ncbi:hypothetical protein [Bulleidia extructa]
MLGDLVVFAIPILGAGVGMIPYIAVSRMIIQICSGDDRLESIILMAIMIIIAFFVGMICYMGMIKDDEKRYAGFIKAIKAMVATIVEYIGGIEVVKIFN